MGGDNPTLASAEQDTGFAPLNAGPQGPQPPQHAPVVSDPTIDQVPAALQHLPAPFEAFVLPLDSDQTDSTKLNNQAIAPARFPSDAEFARLVQAGLYPEGPVRVEELTAPEHVAWPPGRQEVVGLVASAAPGNGQTKLYKVVRGLSKADVFVVKVDVDRERLIGVRFSQP